MTDIYVVKNTYELTFAEKQDTYIVCRFVIKCIVIEEEI